MRVDLGFGKSQRPTDPLDKVWRHVLLVDVVAFNRFMGRETRVVAFSWLRDHADPSGHQGIVGGLERGAFILRMVQGVVEQHPVEVASAFQVFEVANLKSRGRRVLLQAPLLGQCDHSRGNIHPQHLVSAVCKKDARPAGTAPKIENSAGRLGQEIQDLADLHQMPSAIGIGEWLVLRVPAPFSANYAGVLDFARLHPRTCPGTVSTGTVSALVRQPWRLPGTPERRRSTTRRRS